eukprot:1196356-Prorocentrum_minimum.AAC.1
MRRLRVQEEEKKRKSTRSKWTVKTLTKSTLAITPRRVVYESPERLSAWGPRGIPRLRGCYSLGRRGQHFELDVPAVGTGCVGQHRRADPAGQADGGVSPGPPPGQDAHRGGRPEVLQRGADHNACFYRKISGSLYLHTSPNSAH